MKKLIAMLVFCTGWSQAQKVYLDTLQENRELVDASYFIFVKHGLLKNGAVIVRHPGEAEFTVRPYIIKTGSSYSIILEKRKQGAIIQSVEKTAATPEELGFAIRHAVDGLFYESHSPDSHGARLQSKPKRVHRVGQITQREQRMLMARRQSRNFHALGFGPSGLFNMGSANLSYLFRYAYYMEVMERGAIHFKSDNVIDIQEGLFFSSLSLGINLYITDTDLSPFAGFDMGFGVSRNGFNAFPYGYVVGGTLGLSLFRTSTAHFNISTNGQVILDFQDTSEIPWKTGLGIELLF